ncbi:Uma2 family endonuclease [Prochlorothrix hollandica]|uniref:Putative restriction endonuclease domain-containing protein n=1 Tax=Prochlorothrix hollandica PCC 9006 = CALU 1027 TaxID=317619 RepID=A0A0M2PRZ0_PROHO|nr:Uma2 family endonuclease [Prochlorothrix hollandica]KKI98899.1 hypothetical protein PROH_13735 [Prochlorothrix hollandica PCC 9006 = CALU 1027]
MVTTISPLQGLALGPIGEQRVCFRGLTWDAYQQIFQALPHRRGARLTYDRGTLEITMPLESHEFSLRLIEVFIRCLVFELGLKLKTMGSTTLNRQDLDRSSEPDCAYYIQNQPKVAGRRVDLATDPPPDLIVEVDITSTDIDKNCLYAALGVPELWRYNGRELSIYRLENGLYQNCDRSPTFPWIEKQCLYDFLAEAEQDEIEAEQNLREFVQQSLHQPDQIQQP